MFDILLTDEAREQLNRLKADRGLSKRFKAVKKTLHSISQNPRHPGLQTFEAYAEQLTPSAYRVFWYYGPAAKQITIIAITPHP